MISSTLVVAILGLPGGAEWIVIAILGLLIFGRRLPEVGKSLGKSIVEFKKGLRGMEDEIDRAGDEGQADMLPPPTPERKDTVSRSSTESREREPVSQGAGDRDASGT
jgi:sec-independent protein translocase protein TatA